MSDLIITKQLLHKEDLPSDEKHELKIYRSFKFIPKI